MDSFYDLKGATSHDAVIALSDTEYLRIKAGAKILFTCYLPPSTLSMTCTRTSSRGI